MATVDNNPIDWSKHQQVIEALARESSATVEKVRALFEEEHARLQADARIKTYVSVIATRLVRTALHADKTVSRADSN